MKKQQRTNRREKDFKEKKEDRFSAKSRIKKSDKQVLKSAIKAHKKNTGAFKHNEFKEQKNYDDYVIGVQAVKEALLSSRNVNRLMVAKSRSSKQIRELVELAKERKVLVQEVDPKKISEVADGENHQGVVAYVSPYSYADFDEVLNHLSDKEHSIVLVLDHITDVHNLGSIIRTADAAGVDLIIIPSRRSALVNSTVSKTSAGAVEHVKISIVSSLATAIKTLQKKDFWVYAADMDGQTHYQNAKYAKKSVIVVGSEETGLSAEVRKACDQIVKIDMVGKINSLNVSVAAALIMYQVKNTKYSN